MYAITGITGQVGGELARTLLTAGQPVRAIVRDKRKGEAWVALGCEVAIAEMEDAAALTAAFKGASAVFILPPSEFDPSPGYPEAQVVIDAVSAALKAARPGRVLLLSTIGADATTDNLLSQRTMMEAALRALHLPLTILRPAWFMENVAWDIASARETGRIHSFLQPTNKTFPMVATRDIGQLAAKLIQEDWTGTRVVELEGPCRVSPDMFAEVFTAVIGKPVQAVPVPRDTWEELFRSQGMKNPQPRIRMLDGFNESWIEFEDGGSKAVKGRTSVKDVISDLVARAT